MIVFHVELIISWGLRIQCKNKEIFRNIFYYDTFVVSNDGILSIVSGDIEWLFAPGKAIWNYKIPVTPIIDTGGSVDTFDWLVCLIWRWTVFCYWIVMKMWSRVHNVSITLKKKGCTSTSIVFYSVYPNPHDYCLLLLFFSTYCVCWDCSKLLLIYVKKPKGETK